MRHVFETMGTVASIDVPRAHVDELARIESIFRTLEARFSLYSATSELSRVANGSLSLVDATSTLRGTYARATEWRIATGGIFSPHRPDGAIDLNGIVKAEAIEEAGALLRDAGCDDWSINVGGDLLTAGRNRFLPWVTGIADPMDESSLLCSVALGGSRRAIATSGSAQRGDHIWLGGSRRPSQFRQASVIADDIVTADVLATAVIAGGPDALDDLTERWDVDVLTVDRDWQLAATPGFRAAIAASMPVPHSADTQPVAASSKKVERSDGGRQCSQSHLPPAMTSAG
ncbi:MAG: thiamine biosynthesis protein [Rhodoglobus sp.]|nr:thiamine biosynthesis protein [Rhodoglobus sp.]